MLAQWTSSENLAAPLARACFGGTNPTAAQRGRNGRLPGITMRPQVGIPHR